MELKHATMPVFDAKEREQNVHGVRRPALLDFGSYRSFTADDEINRRW